MKNCEIVGNLSEPLGDMPAVVWRKGLYVFGGASGDEVRQDILRIDGTGHNVEKIGSMPFKSRGHCAVLQGDQVFLLGGFEEGTLCHAYCYDMISGNSERLPDMPMASAWFSAVVQGRKLYVMGGFSIPSGYWKDMVIYDVDKKQWETVEDCFPQEIFPQRLLGSNSSLTIGGHIISFGGADSFDKSSMRANPLNVVASFNPSSQHWRGIECEIDPREGLVGLTQGKDVYLVGGASIGEMHRYPFIDKLDLEKGKAERFAKMTQGRTGAACGIIDDHLLIAGGVIGAVNEMTDRIERVRLDP